MHPINNIVLRLTDLRLKKYIKIYFFYMFTSFGLFQYILYEVNDARNLAGATKCMRIKHLVAAVEESLAPEMARAFKHAQGKGASNWLSALPLEDIGFTFNKGEFHDAIAIRYGLPLESLPSMCPCDKPFNLDHALDCKRGGFVIMRHNNVN